MAIEAEAGDLAGIDEEARRTIVTLSNLRGGSEVLARAKELGGAAVERPRAAWRRRTRGLRGAWDRRSRSADQLLRDLGYYTGAILEACRPRLRRRARRWRQIRRAARASWPPAPGRHCSTWIGSTSLRRRSRSAPREPGLGTRRGLRLAMPRGALFGPATPTCSTGPAFDTSEPRSGSLRTDLRPRRAHHRHRPPLGRPHVRGAGCRRARDHRQGRARRAVGPRPSTSSPTSGSGAAAWSSRPRRDRIAFAEAERRLGRMRIATKYPRTAESILSAPAGRRIRSR